MESFVAVLIVAAFIWLPFSIVVAVYGNDREIGGWQAFFLSCFFSPIVGFICVGLSPSLREERYKAEMLELKKKEVAFLELLSLQNQNLQSKTV